MNRNSSQVLTAGGAAACWQKNLTRHTARLQRLQQLCTWVKPLIETRPKLRDRPLWGECLVELTRPEAQAEVSNPETPHSRHRQANRADLAAPRQEMQNFVGKRLAPARNGTSGRMPSGNQVHGGKSFHDTVPQPHELSRKASPVLLERMAGQTPKDTDSITPARGMRRQLDRSAEKSLLPSQQVAVSQQEWLQAIAHRAGRFFDRTGLPVAPALEAQWSAGLDGAPAPPELLRQWLVAPSIHGVPSIRQMKDKARPHQLSGVELNQRQAAYETDPFDPRSAPSPLPVAGWKGEVETEVTSSYRIAPPAAAPSLPHLLPPQGSYESTPALAAIITRQRARQEAATSEDDLAGLAENIKRILDEEARRHGIDV